MTPAPLDREPPAWPARALLVLALLWLTYALHGVDRSVLTVLLIPIQQEFRLSDTQLGLLAGLIYAVPYALAGLPLGFVADRSNRSRMLALLLAIWSMATLLAGLSRGLPALLVLRAIVGAAEAGGPILAVSILADSFDARTRTAALGILYTAPFAGVVGGSAIAGLVGAHHGWRAALLVAGMPGIALAIVIFLSLREPARAASGTEAREASPGRAPALSLIVRDPVVLRLSAGIVATMFVILGVNGWIPTYLGRELHVGMAQVGTMTALIVGLMAGLGNGLGGLVFSRLFGVDRRRSLRACGIVLLVCAIIGPASALARHGPFSIALLAMWSLAITVCTAPSIGMLVESVPARVRGRVLAVVFVSSNLVGAGAGPATIGLISDAFARLGDPHALAHSLAIVAAFALVPAGLFLSAAGALRHARDRSVSLHPIPE